MSEKIVLTTVYIFAVAFATVLLVAVVMILVKGGA